MPIIWNLKKWLAVEHDIYRPSELRSLLAEKAGVHLSLQAVSALFHGRPNALRLQTMQALCNALHCTLSDFCQVLPDSAEKQRKRGGGGAPVALYGARKEQAGKLEYVSPERDEAERAADVDPATRAIILRILEEQGLVPRGSDAAPQSPAAQRQLIGMLIPTWVWPFITDLTRGIVETISQTPYDLVLYSINPEDLDSGNRAVIDRIQATRLTAGLLAVFPGKISRYLTQLYESGFPIVIVDDQQEQEAPWIRTDNFTGAYLAVRHLINLGHRRIAHIQGPPEYLASQDRYRGYCRALQEAGIVPEPELLLVGDFTPPSGRACASRLFALPVEKRPTAIFAAADQMAYGVLTAAEEYGLSVPQDIALVGFDDDAPSVHVHPALTTVRQPYFEMGQRGIELLLAMLAGARRDGAQETGGAAGPVSILIPTDLVVRASCGANYRSSVSPSSNETIW